MTGFQSKKDMAQAKFDDGDALTIAYQSGYYDGKKAAQRTEPLIGCVNHDCDKCKAQPEQEPVGKFAKFTDGIWREVTDGSPGVSLYTATQRTWVGLTFDEKQHALYISAWKTSYMEAVVEYIEAKLKEKNNG